MCAILASEPFYLRPWEIARLTDYQIRRIYFHPRNNDGSIDLYAYATERPSKFIDYESEFKWSWMQKGLTEEEADAKWEEVLKSKPKA